MNALRPVTKRDSAISARSSAPAPDGLRSTTPHLEDRTMTELTIQYQKPALTRIGTLRELTLQIVVLPPGHCDAALSPNHTPVCASAR